MNTINQILHSFIFFLQIHVLLKIISTYQYNFKLIAWIFYKICLQKSTI